MNRSTMNQNAVARPNIDLSVEVDVGMQAFESVGYFDRTTEVELSSREHVYSSSLDGSEPGPNSDGATFAPAS